MNACLQIHGFWRTFFTFLNSIESAAKEHPTFVPSEPELQSMEAQFALLKQRNGAIYRCGHEETTSADHTLMAKFVRCPWVESELGLESLPEDWRVHPNI